MARERQEAARAASYAETAATPPASALPPAPEPTRTEPTRPPSAQAQSSQSEPTRAAQAPPPPPAAAPSPTPSAPAAPTPPPAAKEARDDTPEDPAAPKTWSEAEIADAARECDQLLQSIGAKVEALPPLRQGSCGTPAPLRVSRIGSGDGIALDPPAVLNCPMVAHLYQWIETVAQPAARESLGARIVKLVNASAYVCRNRYNDPAAKISEHAFANAIDVSAFELSDSRRIDVKTYWGKDVAAALAAEAAAQAAAEAAARAAAEAQEKAAAAEAGKTGASTSPAPKGTPPLPVATTRATAALKPRTLTAGLAENDKSPGKRERRSSKSSEAPRVSQRSASSPVEYGFLHRLHSSACGIFTTVLGPEANTAHQDHFHLDLKQRRHTAICE